MTQTNDLLYAEVLALIEDLCVIPAPSTKEDDRAKFVCEWFKNNGFDGAYIDEAKNVIVEIGDIKSGATLMMAHTDIVFEDVDLALQKDGDKWSCPGIGDDTANLAVLMVIAKHYLKDSKTPFLVVANSCEEGRGNLFGSKTIYKNYGKYIDRVIVFDGYLEVINDIAVGSIRYEVEIDVKGGHSFRDFGNENAIVTASKIIVALNKIPLPKGGITTYNIGTIKGGTTVNSIAQKCTFLYEIRSDTNSNILYMKDKAEELFLTNNATYKVIGERPCAMLENKEKQDELLRRVGKVFGRYGIVKTYPASTDCNLFLSKNVPSVCVGLISGKGAHTLEEYIEISSINKGILIAIDLINEFKN